MDLATLRPAIAAQLVAACAAWIPPLTRQPTVLAYKPPLPYVPGEGQGWPLVFLELEHLAQELIIPSGAIVGATVENPSLFRVWYWALPAKDQNRTVAAIEADRDAFFDALRAYYKVPGLRAITCQATHVGIPLIFDPVLDGDYTNEAGQVVRAVVGTLGFVPCSCNSQQP
jgi:hypothetical protein